MVCMCFGSVKAERECWIKRMEVSKVQGLLRA